MSAARQPHALVCDADDVSARWLSRALGRGGFQVDTCATAAECQGAVARNSVDLVVTAILLPDLDGLALTRRLRGADADLPILVVSSLQAEQRALEAGASAFLLKPVKPDGLLALAHRLLGTPDLPPTAAEDA